MRPGAAGLAGVCQLVGREDAIGRGLMAILVPVLLLILIAWLVRGAGWGFFWRLWILGAAP